MPSTPNNNDRRDDAHHDGLAARLMADGYLIMPGLLEEDGLARLYAELDPQFAAARFGRGLFYGGGTKRFGSVLRRSREARRIAMNPAALSIAERVLGEWCQCLQLNLTQAIEIHPGSPVQAPHRDQDMWAGPKGQMQYMVNVMWALDDFTLDNGATRIWPKSHLQNPDAMLPEEAAKPAVMPRGSALFFLGSTLHSGGANRTDKPRRGLIVSYCLGWLKPWENQWLAYPPSVARDFSRDLAALVGYRQHLPSLGNYEGQCPSLLLDQRMPTDFLPFTDALKEEQYDLMRQYYASIETQDAHIGGADGLKTAQPAS